MHRPPLAYVTGPWDETDAWSRLTLCVQLREKRGRGSVRAGCAPRDMVGTDGHNAIWPWNYRWPAQVFDVDGVAIDFSSADVSEIYGLRITMSGTNPCCHHLSVNELYGVSAGIGNLIPEPGTFTLLVIGLAGLVQLTWRRCGR